MHRDTVARSEIEVRLYGLRRIHVERHPHESGGGRTGAPRSRSAPQYRDAFRHVSIDAGGNRRAGSRIGDGVAAARCAGGAVSDGGRRGVGVSAPRRTRTPSLLIRSQALYPVELWARVGGTRLELVASTMSTWRSNQLS